VQPFHLSVCARMGLTGQPRGAQKAHSNSVENESNRGFPERRDEAPAVPGHTRSLHSICTAAGAGARHPGPQHQTRSCALAQNTAPTLNTTSQMAFAPTCIHRASLHLGTDAAGSCHPSRQMPQAVLLQAATPERMVAAPTLGWSLQVTSP